ncbi:hypothetical protein PAPYR_5808 [Paratrimastix pyriformis]|uniref:Uncharacterized protein n=1 Tax=Paratrimastix pyriformis TaxID=342808 RepID=A0ABQ8ULP2_9EUKA|nr:hypothetical protein PAPYR_5808 [Paratrimastix pyriformis]
MAAPTKRSLPHPPPVEATSASTESAAPPPVPSPLLKDSWADADETLPPLVMPIFAGPAPSLETPSWDAATTDATWDAPAPSGVRYEVRQSSDGLAVLAPVNLPASALPSASPDPAAPTPANRASSAVPRAPSATTQSGAASAGPWSRSAWGRPAPQANAGAAGAPAGGRLPPGKIRIPSDVTPRPRPSVSPRRATSTTPAPAAIPEAASADPWQTASRRRAPSRPPAPPPAPATRPARPASGPSRQRATQVDQQAMGNRGVRVVPREDKMKMMPGELPPPAAGRKAAASRATSLMVADLLARQFPTPTAPSSLVPTELPALGPLPAPATAPAPAERRRGTRGGRRHTKRNRAAAVVVASLPSAAYRKQDGPAAAPLDRARLRMVANPNPASQQRLVRLTLHSIPLISLCCTPTRPLQLTLIFLCTSLRPLQLTHLKRLVLHSIPLIFLCTSLRPLQLTHLKRLVLHSIPLIFLCTPIRPLQLTHLKRLVLHSIPLIFLCTPIRPLQLTHLKRLIVEERFKLYQQHIIATSHAAPAVAATTAAAAPEPGATLPGEALATTDGCLSEADVGPAVGKRRHGRRQGEAALTDVEVMLDARGDDDDDDDDEQEEPWKDSAEEEAPVLDAAHDGEQADARAESRKMTTTDAGGDQTGNSSEEEDKKEAEDEQNEDDEDDEEKGEEEEEEDKDKEDEDPLKKAAREGRVLTVDEAKGELTFKQFIEKAKGDSFAYGCSDIRAVSSTSLVFVFPVSSQNALVHSSVPQNTKFSTRVLNLKMSIITKCTFVHISVVRFFPFSP